MDSPPVNSVPVAEIGLRPQAKERLYVIFQVGGWGFLFGLGVVVSLLLTKSEDHHDPVNVVASQMVATAMGLLLTHYARPLVTRWNWKQLGWRPLVPRVLALSAVLSLLWGLSNYGLIYGVMRVPWTAKFNPLLLFAISWIQGTTLFVGWWCIYFFYHLFDRFNRSEIERLRLATSVKEAELRALKSQINPHFIFNSLNSLRGLIDENPDRARQAVTQLANLLRYSLQSGQLETVPFEDELQTVNDYLALEQVRHEERLRVRLDVASGRAQPVRFRPCCCRPWWKTRSSTESRRGARAARSPIIARCEPASSASRSPIPVRWRRAAAQPASACATPPSGCDCCSAPRRGSICARLRRAGSWPSVTIPLEKAPGAGARAVGSPKCRQFRAPGAAAEQKTVRPRMKALLIDDERLARNELRRLLAAHADIAIVGEAANADEARERIAELGPTCCFWTSRCRATTDSRCWSRWSRRCRR